jgi:hypothetical protein
LNIGFPVHSDGLWLGSGIRCIIQILALYQQGFGSAFRQVSWMAVRDIVINMTHTAFLSNHGAITAERVVGVERFRQVGKPSETL